jgi:hypothetical protein
MTLKRVDVDAYSNNAVRREDGRFYMAREVDAEIDSLKAEIARLKQEYSESMIELGMDTGKLKAENGMLLKDAERLKGLRKLCGYTQDGSQEYVSIYQDDATHTFVLRGGKKAFEGSSFKQVIDAAMSALPDTKGE